MILKKEKKMDESGIVRFLSRHPNFRNGNNEIVRAPVIRITCTLLSCRALYCSSVSPNICDRIHPQTFFHTRGQRQWSTVFIRRKALLIATGRLLNRESSLENLNYSSETPIQCWAWTFALNHSFLRVLFRNERDRYTEALTWLLGIDNSYARTGTE